MSNPQTPPAPPRPLGRLLTAALAAVAIYYAVWGGEYSAFDIRRLRAEQRAELARMESATRRVDSLRIVARRLENDPAAIEAVARERFGMIRKGEVLYRFVEVDTTEDASGEPPTP